MNEGERREIGRKITELIVTKRAEAVWFRALADYENELPYPPAEDPGIDENLLALAPTRHTIASGGVDALLELAGELDVMDRVPSSEALYYMASERARANAELEKQEAEHQIERFQTLHETAQNRDLEVDLEPIDKLVGYFQQNKRHAEIVLAHVKERRQ